MKISKKYLYAAAIIAAILVASPLVSRLTVFAFGLVEMVMTYSVIGGMIALIWSGLKNRKRPPILECACVFFLAVALDRAYQFASGLKMGGFYLLISAVVAALEVLVVFYIATRVPTIMADMKGSETT